MPNFSTLRQTPELVALGATIRRLRFDKGISQEDLALLIGVDRSYLGRVERGDNNVAILTLKKISDGLGTSTSEILRLSSL